MTPTPAQPIRFSGPSSATPAIGMAPMVDIVLLLICFYLFVAKSVSDAEDPGVRPPVVAAGVTQEKSPASLVINLRGDGRLLADGREVTFEALEGVLHTAIGSGQATVVVRADRGRPFGELHRIQELCREAGVATIVLRTLESD